MIHCRTCGKRSKKNSLVELFPDIKKYWNYDKNEHEPDFYTISSGKKYISFVLIVEKNDMVQYATFW